MNYMYRSVICSSKMKRKYCAIMRERLREREGAPFLAVCHRTNPEHYGGSHCTNYNHFGTGESKCSIT